MLNNQYNYILTAQKRNVKEAPNPLKKQSNNSRDQQSYGPVCQAEFTNFCDRECKALELFTDSNHSRANRD